MEVRCGAEKMRRVRAAATRSTTLVVIAALLVPVATRAAAPTDLAIHATGTSFRVGTEGSYHVSVSNAGDVDTDAPVRVTSTLPTGLSFRSGGGGGWSCSGAGRAVECSAAGVPAGTTTAFSLTVDVCTDASGVITQLTVLYDGDTNGANDRTQRTTSVKPGQCTARAVTPTPLPGLPTRTPTGAGAPTNTRTPIPASTDLMLTTTNAGSFTIGSEPSYFHVVTNVGTRSTNVPMTLVDSLPTGINFVSAVGDGWTCSASGRTVTCINPNPLDVEDIASLTLTVTVGTDAYPSVTNRATLSYPADIAATNNTTRRPTTIRRPRPGGRPLPRSTPTRTIAAPAGGTATRTPTASPTPRRASPTNLLLTKTASGIFFVGRPALYVLRVSNIGPLTADAPITVTDTLPASLSFISATGSGWSCTAVGQTVTCTNANGLLPGAVTTLTLSVSVGDAAFPTVTNMATATYANDTDTSNNTARRPTTVRR